uniref:Gametocyte-specific factor 1-like n=1 Tax=Geotrypetes seraphini TaxID=260995 RepID=A0A6P8QWU0_GEOSA|nr:gametocyte-specific factor 1-like [Geotrypetes seraphini]
MEPESLVQCPYDKNHQIRPSRLPYHLVKCKESNPQKAKMLATCPYNARHRVPKQELKLHISTCTDRSDPVLFEEISIKPKEEVPNPSSFWKSPPCEENWDVEEKPVSPFILGGSVNSILMKQRAQQSFNSANLGSSSTSIAQVPIPNSWKQDKSLKHATRGCNLADKLNLKVAGPAYQPDESTAYWMNETTAAHPSFPFKTVRGEENSRSSQIPTALKANPWEKD